MNGLAALLIVAGGVLSIVLILWFMYHVIELERLPWQHRKECPCGTCFSRRMREAVERAEYRRQEEEIRNAVREVEQNR